MIFFLSIELSEDKESTLMNFPILEINEKSDRGTRGRGLSPLRGGNGFKDEWTS